MTLAIGIDLGTTNSVGAFKFADLEIVDAVDNTPPDRVLTPSIVAYTHDGSRVGHEALAQQVTAPERAVITVPAYFNDKQRYATLVARARTPDARRATAGAHRCPLSSLRG
ncbi:MAG: Hsp70 family protein [Candidatus Sericytochromatia bacterium]|nr:Hsp70 family protein [Candidatus Sericytochromatia bacterium]